MDSVKKQNSFVKLPDNDLGIIQKVDIVSVWVANNLAFKCKHYYVYNPFYSFFYSAKLMSRSACVFNYSIHANVCLHYVQSCLWRYLN